MYWKIIAILTNIINWANRQQSTILSIIHYKSICIDKAFQIILNNNLKNNNQIQTRSFNISTNMIQLINKIWALLIKNMSVFSQYTTNRMKLLSNHKLLQNLESIPDVHILSNNPVKTITVWTILVMIGTS